MSGKKVLLPVICLLALVVNQSCKKGCTDKKALNYMSAARDNDGTCLYCDSTLQQLDFNEQNIEDENSQSQFAFRDVLLLYVENRAQIYTGNGCQKYNLGGSTSSSSCTPATTDGFLLNLTSQTIIFSGQIQIEFDNQEFITYNFNSVQIGPLDTLKVANLGSTCISPGNDFLQLQVEEGYTIQYK